MHIKSNKSFIPICNFNINTSFLEAIDQPEEIGYFNMKDKTI